MRYRQVSYAYNHVRFSRSVRILVDNHQTALYLIGLVIIKENTFKQMSDVMCFVFEVMLPKATLIQQQI